MLKAVIDTEAANQGSLAGTVVENTARLVDALKAEAAYFVVQDGQRTCIIVFDMEDPSQIPAVCEPMFLSTKAKITLTPCMTLEVLREGFLAYKNTLWE